MVAGDPPQKRARTDSSLFCRMLKCVRRFSGPAAPAASANGDRGRSPGCSPGTDGDCLQNGDLIRTVGGFLGDGDGGTTYFERLLEKTKRELGPHPQPVEAIADAVSKYVDTCLCADRASLGRARRANRSFRCALAEKPRKTFTSGQHKLEHGWYLMVSGFHAKGDADGQNNVRLGMADVLSTTSIAGPFPKLVEVWDNLGFQVVGNLPRECTYVLRDYQNGSSPRVAFGEDMRKLVDGDQPYKDSNGRVRGWAVVHENQSFTGIWCRQTSRGPRCEVQLLTRI